MKNTITTCCNVPSHCTLVLPIQMPSRHFEATLSRQTTCWFGYSMSMQLWSHLIFGKNGQSCCVCALTWGSAQASLAPALGPVVASTQVVPPCLVAPRRDDGFLRDSLRASSCLIFLVSYAGQAP